MLSSEKENTEGELSFKAIQLVCCQALIEKACLYSPPRHVSSFLLPVPAFHCTMAALPSARVFRLKPSTGTHSRRVGGISYSTSIGSTLRRAGARKRFTSRACGKDARARVYILPSVATPQGRWLGMQCLKRSHTCYRAESMLSKREGKGRQESRIERHAEEKQKGR